MQTSQLYLQFPNKIFSTVKLIIRQVYAILYIFTHVYSCAPFDIYIEARNPKYTEYFLPVYPVIWNPNLNVWRACDNFSRRLFINNDNK